MILRKAIQFFNFELYRESYGDASRTRNVDDQLDSLSLSLGLLLYSVRVCIYIYIYARLETAVVKANFAFWLLSLLSIYK